MAEVTHRYNEYGEALPDEEWEAEAPRIRATWARPLNDAVMSATVMNYRRSKNPNKLSEFERASLDGTEWKPRMNKRQWERSRQVSEGGEG